MKWPISSREAQLEKYTNPPIQNNMAITHWILCQSLSQIQDLNYRIAWTPTNFILSHHSVFLYSLLSMTFILRLISYWFLLIRQKSIAWFLPYKQDKAEIMLLKNTWNKNPYEAWRQNEQFCMVTYRCFTQRIGSKQCITKMGTIMWDQEF